jgi:hypothetical protein
VRGLDILVSAQVAVDPAKSTVTDPNHENLRVEVRLFQGIGTEDAARVNTWYAISFTWVWRVAMLCVLHSLRNFQVDDLVIES